MKGYFEHLLSIIKKENKLVKNTGYLYVLQVTNYLLPLITLPYLSRKLGANLYGLVLFAQVLNQYFLIITDYGFNFIGTKQIAENKDCKKTLQQLFIDIYFAKFILFLVSAIVLIILLFVIEKLTKDPYLYLLTLGMTFGQVLSPTWYFQGVQKMKILAYLNFISKITLTSLIFIFVKEYEDYILVPIFYSIGFLFAGILGGYLAIKDIELQKVKFSLTNSIYQLKIGFNVFLSNLNISLFTVTNGFILGFVASNQTVGYYVTIDKVVQAIKFGFNPLFQSLFPRLASDFKKTPARTQTIMNKLGVVLTGLGLVLTGLLFLVRDSVLEILLGAYDNGAIYIYNILIWLVAITPLSYLYFNLIAILLGKDYLLPRIYFIGAIINFVLLGILIVFNDFGGVGCAIASLVTQLINVILIFKYVHK